MTQKKIEPASEGHYILERNRGTRIDNAPPDLYDPNALRLGRRESEPHSAEVTYLHDILTANFPEGRAVWDLHHYFLGKKGALKGKKIDIQFDVSFFKDLKISHTLSSYDAHKHDGQIPDLAINVLSKSTWRNDLSENIDVCRDLGVPVYVVFSPYKVTRKMYHPPFLRVYILQDDGSYKQEDLRKTILEDDGTIIEENIIDIHDKLPFSLGLMRLKQEHEGNQPLYRLVLIDLSELRILPTKMEKVKEDKEKQLEDKEKQLEDKEKQLEDKDKQLEDKDKQLEDKEKEIERLKARL